MYLLFVSALQFLSSEIKMRAVKKPVIMIHYGNTPIIYTVIFHGCKNGYFQLKNCDIFLIFAQNIDRGYTLEPPL